MNWRDAYFIQAWSDFEVFREMNRSRHPLCHRLHYLQMATEKLAKGFFCESSGRAPARKTHFAFTRFLHYSKRRKGLHDRLGYERNRAAYAAYIDSLMAVAEKIENLAPVGGSFDKFNTEYPWKDADGVVRCPARYDFSEFRKRDLAEIQGLILGLFRTMGFQ